MGGGERHLLDLVNGLVRRGHDVYVALRSDTALATELSAIPTQNIFHLPLRNALDVGSARELAKIVRRHGIQIVHAHMARDYPPAAYAATASKHSRLIVTRHVLFPMNRIHSITLSKAAKVIAVSQAVARQLVMDGIATPEKIAIVLNGIDGEKLKGAKQNFNRPQFLSRHDLPADARLVGTVGELTPLKGQIEFLHAAARLSQEFPNLYFVIAGIDHSRSQEHRGHILQLIEELKLGPRVKLLGWMDDLAQLYCALEVFVSASHTESFGLAIVEAMATGSAVVATRTEGAQETVRDGSTGLLIDIQNVDQLVEAIRRLLRDEELRKRLGSAASEAAAHFSLQRMVDETERIYVDAIGD